MKIATINVDASFSKQYKVGTYAYSIVCDEFTHVYSGPIKSNVSNPNEAEAAAICNALHFFIANKDFLLSRGLYFDRIVINTDNKYCTYTINKKAAAENNGLFAVAYNLIEQIRINNHVPARIKFAHIRYIAKHQRSSMTKKKANQRAIEFCDKQAKFEMGKRIAQIKLEQRLLPSFTITQ